MKIPNGEEDLSAVQDANARANRAQEEAAALRTRLDTMEALLTDTRSKISDANAEIAIKDQRLVNIHLETKTLAQSVAVLGERFQNLRKLQGELKEKREAMEAIFGPNLTTIPGAAVPAEDEQAADESKVVEQAQEPE